MSDLTHLPGPGVVLDLDAAVRKPETVEPPFIVKIGGRDIVFADPGDLDWKDLALVDGPQDLMRISLTEEDRTFIFAQDLPSWKFGQLMESYNSHYKISDKMREARKQAALQGNF